MITDWQTMAAIKAKAFAPKRKKKKKKRSFSVQSYFSLHLVRTALSNHEKIERRRMNE